MFFFLCWFLFFLFFFCWFGGVGVVVVTLNFKFNTLGVLNTGCHGYYVTDHKLP